MSTSIPVVGPVARDADGAARAESRTSLVVGAAVLAVTATLSVVAHNSLATMLADLSIEMLAAVGVFAVLVPRGLRQGTAGVGSVVLGLASVVTVLVFYTGLPLVLGVGAALIGSRDHSRSARSRVALVAGLLGVLGYFVAYVTDALPV